LLVKAQRVAPLPTGRLEDLGAKTEDLVAAFRQVAADEEYWKSLPDIIPDHPRKMQRAQENMDGLIASGIKKHDVVILTLPGETIESVMEQFEKAPPLTKEKLKANFDELFKKLDE